MINGVLNIVAAVLFAVVSLKDGFAPVWMVIAGIYLLAGIVDLIVHSVKVHRMKKAALKAEQEKLQKAQAEQQETTVGG